MVFLTSLLMVRSRGPDEWWRKRKIFKLAAYFYGRRRNCYSIAVKSVHRALVYATKARSLKKQDMRELLNTRISAGIEQHMTDSINPYYQLQDGLMKNKIELNRMSLSNLAVFEPATFEALTKIAMHFREDDNNENN